MIVDSGSEGEDEEDEDEGGEEEEEDEDDDDQDPDPYLRGISKNGVSGLIMLFLSFKKHKSSLIVYALLRVFGSKREF